MFSSTLHRLHLYLRRTPEARVKLGICAMDKKVNSKAMNEVIKRLIASEDFDIIVFGDSCIIDRPPEEWPICEALISFTSGGFPLDKAIQYVNLRKPFLINDLEAQKILFDRTKVYEVLKKAGVPIPRFAVVWRERGKPLSATLEEDDAVIINGERFNKPFVEKPVDAEDHYICIYYPRSAGGGCTQLFRKVGNKSSEFFPTRTTIRKDRSYLYEEFLATEGTDVKVYSCGENYAHAEARKSPAVDGRVQRDGEGKEIRYPVMLTKQEKWISQQVNRAFKQGVCGFDLLRANGESFVCDVNGWSFVKGNQKYYDDASHILRETILRRFAPIRLLKSGEPSCVSEEDMQKLEDDLPEDHKELRCVIGVFRHGDRTPKQKLKMVVRSELFLSLFDGKDPRKELKMKSASELQRLLNIARELLSGSGEGESDFEDRMDKLMQVKFILERGSHFGGIYRKIQLKPLKWTRNSFYGKEMEARQGKVREALLILKWGGELTDLGCQQAQDLSERLRSELYPGESDGLLRLHSTFRHNLKIFCSEEGRVQLTAAAFTKGFLQLEGNLTPILVNLCRKDAGLLDDVSDASRDLDSVKVRLRKILSRDEDLRGHLETAVPTCAESLVNAINELGNPIHTFEQLYGLLQLVTSQLKKFACASCHQDTIFHGETITQLLRRWEKLERDFYNKRKKKFDISKIPDIHDCAKYDLLHNHAKLHLDKLPELYRLCGFVADYIVPQEYGITREEKLAIGTKVARNLIKKILLDLAFSSESYQQSSELIKTLETVHRLDSRHARAFGIRSSQRMVRTRFYFTSESHIHSLVNVFRYTEFDKNHDHIFDEKSQKYLESVKEINFLSQFIFLLYEHYSVPEGDPDRYSVELSFSPGVNFEGIETFSVKPGVYGRTILANVSLKKIELFLNKVLNMKVPEIESDIDDFKFQCESSASEKTPFAVTAT
ncbi:uncharacterized protein LOC135119370 isoform X2 [Zophobas morio]|uniref:uncharacterized protein LOC135119370 isoform X2 n=1 Tax=Zophobas morio TaxID=2755281 RepID=UPI0030827E71